MEAAENKIDSEFWDGYMAELFADIDTLHIPPRNIAVHYKDIIKTIAARVTEHAVLCHKCNTCERKGSEICRYCKHFRYGVPVVYNQYEPNEDAASYSPRNVDNAAADNNAAE